MTPTAFFLPLRVSIHTLHELEASQRAVLVHFPEPKRFHSYASRIGSKKLNTQYEPQTVDTWVSIHTLHELEASLFNQGENNVSKQVSIHTLHELEARLALQS